MDKKISSEFAIAVILIIAGTFAYVFWKGGMSLPDNGDSVINFSYRSKEASSTEKQWKLFRNSQDGYEFSLPSDWQLKDEKGKFATQDNDKEISIFIQENSKKYSTEELLSESIELDGQANVQPLSAVDGVLIEKKTDDSLNRTAKILQGENVITLTYMSKGDMAESAELFNKILPTFKAVN